MKYTPTKLTLVKTLSKPNNVIRDRFSYAHYTKTLQGSVDLWINRYIKAAANTEVGVYLLIKQDGSWIENY